MCVCDTYLYKQFNYNLQKTTKSDVIPFLFLSQPSYKACTLFLLKTITVIFSVSVGLNY